MEDAHKMKKIWRIHIETFNQEGDGGENVLYAVTSSEDTPNVRQLRPDGFTGYLHSIELVKEMDRKVRFEVPDDSTDGELHVTNYLPPVLRLCTSLKIWFSEFEENHAIEIRTEDCGEIKRLAGKRGCKWNKIKWQSKYIIQKWRDEGWIISPKIERKALLVAHRELLTEYGV